MRLAYSKEIVAREIKTATIVRVLKKGDGTMKQIGAIAAAVIIFAMAFAARAESPTTKPSTEPTTKPAAEAPSTQPVAVISATDDAALKEKAGFKVTVEGVVDSAEWSSSGKVLNVHFKDVNEDKGLVCCAFSKSKKPLDSAFGGDAIKAWSGAKIQVTGSLHKYEGRIRALVGRLQLIIQDPNQVKIIEPAAK